MCTRSCRWRCHSSAHCHCCCRSMVKWCTCWRHRILGRCQRNLRCSCMQESRLRRSNCWYCCMDLVCTLKKKKATVTLLLLCRSPIHLQNFCNDMRFLRKANVAWWKDFLQMLLAEAFHTLRNSVKTNRLKTICESQQLPRMTKSRTWYHQGRVWWLHGLYRLFGVRALLFIDFN